MDKTKPFGLILPKKSKLIEKKSCVFDDSDDNEDGDKSSKKRSKITFASKSKIFKKETVEDPSIFEYDAIYDDMKAKQIEEIAPKVKKNSRYIQSLIKASDKRKKEYEKRIEKKIQIEREKEGDEFKDKEAFVTASYKKKMQEAEEEEERERRENQLNDLMDVTKQNDLSGFYRHFLKQTVGEEKVPTFGEKMVIKKEKLDEDEESTENTIDYNSEHLHILKDSKSYLKDNVEIDKISKTNNLSSEKNKRKHTDENSNFINSSSKDKKNLNIDENLPKNKSYRNNFDVENDKSIRSNVINSTNISDNINEIDDSHYKETEKYQHDHSTRHDSSSESNEDSQNEEIEKQSAEVQSTKRHDSSSEDEESNDGQNDEQNVPKQKELQEKIDIFAKRTIGIKFDEAQARYFERLALRKARQP